MATQSQAALKGSVRLGNYLKRLRTGYGYSLRRVEERARAEGGEIDNSQLSRYEKGICYPSFDKLRVLANVFNVSIQAFSDVVDLEAYEDLRPDSSDPEEMIEQGLAALQSGNPGEAFACFEQTSELLQTDGEADPGMIARTRVHQAAALSRLGKLSLAELELRAALRQADVLDPELRSRAVLALANIHADQGDLFLAEMEAERASDFAVDHDFEDVAARALHTLGRVLAEQGDPQGAIRRYREASALYRKCGQTHQDLRIRVEIGGCFVDMGKLREGVRLLKIALQEARLAGHRRLEAHAWSNLGTAYFKQENMLQARKCLRESDALANYNNEKHPDLLFYNAYYEWEMAKLEGNPTREKMAFGRLKALRSSLERRFPELEAFDVHIEGGRNHA